MTFLDDHAALMRAQELERRRDRRARLLTQIENEGALLYEGLDSKAAEATLRAVASIARQEDLERERIERSRFGYWTRVWRAITNKQGK